jgi:hypothetical protein
MVITNNLIISIYVYSNKVAHKDCAVNGVRHIFYYLYSLLLRSLFSTRLLGARFRIMLFKKI